MKTKRVSIETYGCAMNKADSEYMAGLLMESGFDLCSTSDNPDIIIVNTCTVKTPTERKILKRLGVLDEERRKVVVTGCMPSVQPNISNVFKRFSFIGTNIEDIVEAVEKTDNGKRFVRISNGVRRIGLPKIRENRLIEIIPIASGCIGKCSYCIVKKARGSLKSYPMKDILESVKEAVSDGVREIWLTAQDTGAYGMDIKNKKGLPKLIKEIYRIDGEFMIRVGMMGPNHAIKMLDDLIGIYKNEKIYKFLHIPVQSGDDKVLKDMNRQYRIKDFIEVVSRFREEIPKITISTDVIVGFPTEDEKAFMNTVNMIKEIKPEVLNISRFWLRPGTEAEEMRQLPTRITKDRSRIVNKIFIEYAKEKNREWIGWEGKALISEIGKDNSFIGRNFAYKPIIIKTNKNIFGRFVNVKVDDATFYDLRGRIM